MGPQCEDGYTKLANELLDALCHTRIPGEPMQIFLTILRKTYGFGKKSDRIPLSQFVEATGITKTHVSRAIAKLAEMNIIAVTQNGNAVTQNGNGSIATYEINKHYSTWNALPKKVTLPKKVINVTQNGNAVTQNGNKRYPKRVPQKKERNLSKETTKETTKEKRLFEICRAWNDFSEMRKKLKKPMTDRAKAIAVENLVKLQSLGNDPVAVLDQSTFRSWQGLFEVKGDDQRSSRASPKSFPEKWRETAATEAFDYPSPEKQAILRSHLEMRDKEAAEEEARYAARP